MGYFKQAVIGISWMSAFRTSSRIITFVRVIILARLLTPSQFGAFGIASLVLSFLEILTETGINIFLVQNKKSVDHYINDAWVLSIIRGIILSLFIILISPFVVMFFKIQEAYSLLLLVSIVPFIRGFINPSIVKFQKELQFKKEFFLRFTVFSFDSTVAIIFALLTRDSTSFIFGLIAGALLEVALSFYLLKPLPRLKFNIVNIKEIFHKGKWVTLFGIFNYIAQEGDNVVVGKMLGAASLGIYQMGYKIATLPISEISDVANKVTFPVYSRISSDKKRLQKAFLRATFFITLFTLLLGGIIFSLPENIYTLILGDKWSNITTIIQVLVVYGILRGISGSASSLFLAVSKQKYVAIMIFIRVIALVSVIVPFVFFFGIIGAGYAALISVVAEIPVIVFFIIRVFK